MSRKVIERVVAVISRASILKIVLWVCIISTVTGCSSRYIAYKNDPEGKLMINEFSIVEKKIPSFSFVHYRGSIAPESLVEKSKEIAKRVFITANVQDMALMGPLTLTFGDLRALAGAPLDVSIGFPATGEFTPRSGVTLKTLPSLKCLTVSLPVGIRDIDVYWAALVRATYKAGYSPSGEFRSVLKYNDTNTGYLVELQVGV